jgi:serine/threonine protein kinase
LGVILYEMATGRTPYRAETPMAVVLKHINDPLLPPRKLNPELPEAVELVILKALSKTREDRYQTAGDMVQAIQAAIPDIPAVSTSGQTKTLQAVITPVPTLEHQPAEVQATARVEKPERVLPNWVLAAIGVIVVILAIAGGLFAVFGRNAKSAPQPTPQTVTTAVVLPTELPTPIATSKPIVQATFTLPSSTIQPSTEQTPGKAIVILHNITQTTIVHVYFGTAQWGGWGGEQLGNSPIPPGGTHTWQLQPGAGIYDLKAEDSNHKVLNQQIGVSISGIYDWYVGGKP